MNKFLRVTFSDGKVYDIPAEFIAKSRAEYFAKKDSEKGEDYTKVYNEELKITLEDDLEIVDWAFNNMDWEDVMEKAVFVNEESEKNVVDYQNEWSNVEHKVVKK